MTRSSDVATSPDGALMRDHMPALDGLRGIAILLVIMTHTAQGLGGALGIYRNSDPEVTTMNLPHAVQVIADSAAHGVQLFFVVSAFTLTLRAGDRIRNLYSYALRRVARVGPGYWVAALFYTIILGMSTVRLFAPHGTNIADVVIALCFGAAWQGGAALAVVPGGWSVSCEVAFYLLLPLLLLVLDRKVWRAVALSGISAVLAIIWSRHLALEGDWSFQVFVHPFMQLPVFLFGITAAFVVTRFNLPKLPITTLFILGFAILIFPFVPITDFQIRKHLTFAAIIAVAVALASVGRSPLGAPWLSHIGKVSYSMYLIHFAILLPSFELAKMLVPASDWRTFAIHYALTVVVSVGLASLTYQYIERPFIRLASRVTRKPPLAQDAASLGS